MLEKCTERNYTDEDFERVCGVREKGKIRKEFISIHCLDQITQSSFRNLVVSEQSTERKYIGGVESVRGEKKKRERNEKSSKLRESFFFVCVCSRRHN